MEAEVCAMTGELYGSESYGLTTQGGTDSILHAMYAYKEWGKKIGITKPNM